MGFTKVCVFVAVFTLVSANPAVKGTPLDSSLEQMRSLCANDDTIACIKYKFMSFLDTVFKKNSYKISDTVEVTRNENRANEVDDARGSSNFEDNVKEYIQTHDVTFKLPVDGTSVTVGAKNLDSDELDFKLKFSEGSGVQESRKSKLKKIMVPILVFLLLKAMTLIPFAIGIFGLKAWNSLQLSIFSFVISVGLSVFQLCKKIAADNTHPQISAHGPWEAYAQRSFDKPAAPIAETAQQLAYNAYY